MDIYILRHAIAVEPGTEGCKNDFDRPLTPEGEQKLRRIARAMRNMALSFDTVLSSPYVRARETAEIVKAALAPKMKIGLRDSLGVDGQPRELIMELKNLDPAPASLLLVGHEPYLSTLVGLLVSGSTRSFVRIKKAGLCKLTVGTVKVGRSAQLEWLLTPRQMLLMA
jgi:phosphohistidine phosphatase